MINYIIKKTIKDYERAEDLKVRSSYGFLGSILGIISNFILFVLKLVIGLLAASLSIIADAINNLSDMGTSFVTLIGFKIAAKPPDAEHPYGHARYEYVTGLIIAFIILSIGISLGKSSLDKIITPQETSFSLITFIILGISILIKLWQMRFYTVVANRINSTALKTAAIDSKFDVVITSAVLTTAIIDYYTALNLDGYIGALVSIFIIIASIKLIRETVNPLIGELPDKKQVALILDKLDDYEHVIGHHDLIIHNYGPLRVYASMHVEICSSMCPMESHELIDRIERDFSEELNINLVLHMDPVDVKDEQTNSLRTIVQDILRQLPEIESMHDFRLVKGKKRTNVLFDVVVPHNSALKKEDIISLLSSHLNKEDTLPHYSFVINIDKSFT